MRNISFSEGSTENARMYQRTARFLNSLKHWVIKEAFPFVAPNTFIDVQVA